MNLTPHMHQRPISPASADLGPSDERMYACPFDRNCQGFKKWHQVGEHLKRSHTLRHACLDCGFRHGALGGQKLKDAIKAHDCSKSRPRSMPNVMSKEQDERYANCPTRKVDWEFVFRLLWPGEPVPCPYLGDRFTTEEVRSTRYATSSIASASDHLPPLPPPGYHAVREDVFLSVRSAPFTDSAIDVRTRSGEDPANFVPDPTGPTSPYVDPHQLAAPEFQRPPATAVLNGTGKRFKASDDDVPEAAGASYNENEVQRLVSTTYPPPWNSNFLRFDVSFEDPDPSIFWKEDIELYNPNDDGDPTQKHFGGD